MPEIIVKISFLLTLSTCISIIPGYGIATFTYSNPHYFLSNVKEYNNADIKLTSHKFRGKDI